LSDLEKYEKEYLDRVNNKKKELSEEEKKAEQGEISKEIESLDNIDYTILESYEQDNPYLQLKLGTISALDSAMKLFRCGLIEKIERKLTFTEKEKIERFKESYQYKQYVARIQRIADSELKDKFREYMAKLQLKTPDDPFDISEKGKQILLTKRKEVESVWQKIRSAFDGKNKQLFREQVDKNKPMFPLFLIMGFANGSMMGAMMGSMGMNSASFMQDMDMAYNEGYADGSAGDIGGEGGDFGGDFGGDSGGGFLDGGMSVGM